MEELLSLAHAAAQRTVEPGEVLLVDGESVSALYVLLAARHDVTSESEW